MKQNLFRSDFRNKFATKSTILPNKLLIPLCILYNVSTYSIWLFHILQGAQQFVLLQLRITETLKNLRGTDEISPFFGRTVWGQNRKKNNMLKHHKYLKLICMRWSWAIRWELTRYGVPKWTKKQSKKWPVRFQPSSLNAVLQVELL